MFKSLSLVDQVANQLKDQILSGALKAGDQLLEDRLKSDFGTSRTPLREAFRILEKEGLVEIFPWRGAFVRKIDRREVTENISLRAVLEGYGASLAYKNTTSQLITRIEQIFKQMERAAQEGNSVIFSEYHFSFHETIIEASEHEALIEILKNLRMHTKWHCSTYHHYTTEFQATLKIHRQIIDLFKGQAVTAKNIEHLFRQHISTAIDGFMEVIDRIERK